MAKRQTGTGRNMRFTIFDGILLASILLTTLIACSPNPIIADQELNRVVTRGDMPRLVAVLPFVDRSHTDGLAELVRISFYSHLSALPYQDVEIHKVDARLKDQQLMSHDRIAQVPVKDLGRIVGADAVIFGEVIEFERVFALFYSQLSVEAAITIYDTRSGRELWADKYISRFHEGGLPLGIISIPLITMRSGLNLRETVKLRAVDELCRELVARIPSPEGAVTISGEIPTYVYEVQAGAFLEENRAVELTRDLRGLGYPAYIRQNRRDRDLWHRVLLGPYADHGKALQVRGKIRDGINMNAYICRVLRGSDKGSEGSAGGQPKEKRQQDGQNDQDAGQGEIGGVPRLPLGPGGSQLGQKPVSEQGSGHQDGDRF